MANVSEVAKYLLSKSMPNTSRAITPLKLQKLVYYAQAAHLKYQNKPLFREHIEAWPHGPVVRELYTEYQKYRYHTITDVKFDNNGQLTVEEKSSIDLVWDELGYLDGKILEELTHQEDPWLDADVKSNETITHDSIKRYFATSDMI